MNKDEIKRTAIRLTREDYDIIEQLALLSDMTTNAYIAHAAKSPLSLQINYDILEQHTKILSDIKNDMKLILHTAIQTGEIYHKDVQNALFLLNQIIENEKELYKELEKDRKKKNTLIKNTLIKELDKRLGK
jgi:hypothetical protein